MEENSGCVFFFIALVSFMLGVTIANVARDKYPQAMDVYQGKTTLEYKVRDGEIVDSVVVFKKK